MGASDDWGKAHKNNSIGFGQAYDNSTNGFAKVYETTESGQTLLGKLVNKLKNLFR